MRLVLDTDVMVAEKLAALRTEKYFRERAAKADIPRALKILERIGGREKPRSGHEVPKKSSKRRPRKSPRN